MDKGSSKMETVKTRVINSTSLFSTTMVLLGASASSHAGLIINEIDYDQPGSDTAEFIELYNSNDLPLILDGYSLELVNGSSGNIYHSFDLSGLSIAANGYLVVCNNIRAVANCRAAAASGSWLQNGGADGDAAALMQGTTLLDAVVYEGIGSFLEPYAEGGSFVEADSGSTAMSLARLPNGIDSDNNAADFASGCLTPGSANLSGTGDCSAIINPVPVPAAAWLFGSGLAGLIGIGRRKASA